MVKYLLEILKEHNTIIIPGLGALTVTNADTGEIMFMPYLQHDNGKLAEYIAEKDGIDEADAKNIVAKFVREIKAELDKGETYAMFELGEFVKKDDGDIEFTHWSNLNDTDDAVMTESPTIVAEEPPVNEAREEEETKEEIEIVLPVETEQDQPTEEELEIRETIEETIQEVEEKEEVKVDIVPPVVETPIAPEEPKIELTEEEIEIKHVIEEAFEEAPDVELETTSQDDVPPIASAEPKFFEESSHVPNEGTFEPSPEHQPVTQEPEERAPLTEEEKAAAGEIIEDEKKDKGGVGFWITLILFALLIIGGGAYVGRNYNDLKQYIPFLADEETEKPEEKSLKEQMYETIHGTEEDSETENTASSEDMNESVEEPEEIVEEPEIIPEEPEVIEKPKVVEKPKVTAPVVSSSSSGPYKVIAGAFSSEDNANRLAAEFRAKGYNSEVFMKGELHAVSMQSYATSEEANANLGKLQSMAPGAWIYYKR